MDRIVPGGVAVDLDAAGMAAIRALLAEIACAMPPLVRTVRQDRVAAGPHRRHRHPVARSWRGASAPAAMSAAPPAAISMRASDLPTRPMTRWLRGAGAARRATSTPASGSACAEIEQSLSLIEQLLDGLPAGDVRAPVAAIGSGEGWR